MAISNTGAALNTLTPRPTQGLFGDNYLSLADMDFTKQFLPDVYEKEVERFGNRTVSGFLRMVGAEMPMSSDQVVWSEQGRLHVAFDDVDVANVAANTVKIDLASADDKNLLGVGMTVIIANGFKVIKARVASLDLDGAGAALSATEVHVNVYGAANLAGLTASGTGAVSNAKLFVYGSEFKKGSADGGKSVDAKFTSFSNKPIILRDKYTVNGSDTAQIGWVEVTSENGASGYLWYLKSEHEARLRFEDQLEMAMVEAVKDTGSAAGSAGGAGFGGSEGLFEAVETRGLIYNDANFGQGSGSGLGEFDDILAELDKQGSIEENMLFLDRATSLSIDNMLANQNSYGTGGTSYGVFNNSEDMALNLGFSGFRRGSYDFYKTDWKYLNDSTTRGLIDDIDGIIVPAGTSTVYDQNLGKNIARPFLHVRYRASEADDRKMKSWITGSVGGNYTSAADEMNVHFLSERALCVQAANNFVLLKSTQV
ncbi:hypothetical protein N9988_00310 [bacterium]|nr:hypothetical protein [bacterium]